MDYVLSVWQDGGVGVAQTTMNNPMLLAVNAMLYNRLSACLDTVLDYVRVCNPVIPHSFLRSRTYIVFVSFCNGGQNLFSCGVLCRNKPL